MRIDNEPTVGHLELDPRARLRHYVGAFKRRWWLVVLPCVIGALLGFLTTPSTAGPAKAGATTTMPTSTFYEATHILIREDASPTGSNSGSGSSVSVNLPQAAYLVNTGEVPAKVAEKLGLAPQEVESHTLGLPRDQVSSIEVKAVGEDPAQVTAMADASAAELLNQLKTQAETALATQRDSIVAQLDDLDRQITDLNGRIFGNPPDRSQLEAQQRSLQNQYSMVYEQFSNLANAPAPTAGLVSLQAARATPISDVEYQNTLRTIRDGAEYVTGATTTVPVDQEVEKPKKTKPVGAGTRGILGGLVGLALGVGMVLLLDRFDARLRRREDVEAASGLTVVAEIPRLKRKAQRSFDLQVVTSPRSRAAEAYRVVRGAFIFELSRMAPSPYANGSAAPAAVLMITSADAGEGKTLSVANLAAVFAEGGLKVLVLNCDFRRPRIHRYLLGDAHDPPPVDDVLAPRLTKVDNVHLVTGIGEGSADANPIEVVALQQQVIDAQRGNYDVILLDTAPFLATNDASELLPRTDLAAVVVRSGKTTAESAHRTAEVLQRFAAPVLGVIFNGSDQTRGAQYYYYGYVEPSTPPQRPPTPPPFPGTDSPDEVGTPVGGI
ncbi:MAG: hypothetical protein EKK60_18315 [Gordonia sp. (in: high G+C Gram-positive bacteria)]|nr:MAG: hypothetical protein EKK60_18315 [Gordonia sp. (in: high G+C Gram-positive bacteria)]